MVCPGFLYLELHGGSCTVVQNSFGASSLHFMVLMATTLHGRNRHGPGPSPRFVTCYAIKNIGTLWNFTKHLHQNPPEPHKVSALEPSAGIFTGTLRSLTRYLHRKLPEPCPEPGVEAAPDRTGANLI